MLLQGVRLPKIFMLNGHDFGQKAAYINQTFFFILFFFTMHEISMKYYYSLTKKHFVFYLTTFISLQL